MSGYECTAESEYVIQQKITTRSEYGIEDNNHKI